jgi:hypothetical protein
MNRLKRLLLAGAVLLAPAPLLGQQGGVPAQEPWERDGVHHLGEGHAFQMLLERRAELSLSDQQVQRLGAIRQRLEAANAPLRERLMAERERFLAERRAQLERMSPEARRAEFARMRDQGRPPLPPSMQPLADQMRENIHGAMREAHAVLNPQQRMQVRRMMREAVGRRGMGGGGRRGGWRPRRQP